MAEDSNATPQSSRAQPHPHAPNPEQHLQEAHHLSIQPQGKIGPTGQAVWALVREEKGKVKTLAVHRGTHREAVTRFYDYIHPEKVTASVAAPRRASAPSRRPRPSGRPSK
ncbi:MAG: hypothetical protein ACM3US_12460 [Sphingomonadaceae bacterium]